MLAQLAGAAPGERELYEPEQCERAQDGRRECEPELAPARGDRAVALVRLEQERHAARAGNSEIDLEQLVEPTLETILRLRKIADFGLRPRDVAELLRTRCVVRADQAVLVRVHDAAGRVPDLDAHDPAAADPAPD